MLHGSMGLLRAINVKHGTYMRVECRVLFITELFCKLYIEMMKTGGTVARGLYGSRVPQPLGIVMNRKM